MKVPAGLSVGVCTHTGLVRGGNEDDFLLVTVATDERPGFVAAIADGMGGAAGGAEASRTALRALGATLLDGATASPGERMRLGFRAAGARVYEAATAVPALRDMGTTMTALWLRAGGALALAHIGDTRAYRLRDGGLEQLTTDHAAEAGEHLLTRCIGGGQLGVASAEPDGAELAFAAGDRFLLATDGVWNVVPDDELRALCADGRSPQETAERLVRRALDHGAPDNATAIVVDVLDRDLGGVVDVELPRHERPDARRLWPDARSLRPPVVSWALLLLALLVLAFVALRAAGVDALAWLPSSV